MYMGPSGADPPTNLYDVLGVDSAATTAEVRAAWRQLARHLHPDAGGDPVAFDAALKAYEILSVQEARAAYDHRLLVGQADFEDLDPNEWIVGTPHGEWNLAFRRGWGQKSVEELWREHNLAAWRRNAFDEDGNLKKMKPVEPLPKPSAPLFNAAMAGLGLLLLAFGVWFVRGVLDLLP